MLMIRRGLQGGLLALCAAALAGSSSGQVILFPAKPAPDFPPGVSTEGGSYRMADFAGKVVVLYFFEKG
jgi:hypothetical protein